MVLGSIILLLFFLFLLLAFSCPMKILWPLYFCLIVIIDISTYLGFWASTFLTLFWIFIGAMAFFPEWRKQVFVSKMIALIQPSFPHMSSTEKEALEAGDTWWEAEFFTGRPNWVKLLSYQTPHLSQREKAFIDNQVSTLCSMLNNWDILNQSHDLSSEVWAYLKKEKFFGLVIPENYGGLGFSPLAHSTIVMKLSTRSSVCAITAMVPNSLGPGELLLKYGTEEQKNYYLPRLAMGEEIPCFGLTSLEAGSDAGAMSDYGIICHDVYEGQSVLGIRLNWSKRYITLAPVATVLGLAFKLYDPNHLLSDKVDLGISVCLVPTHLPGIEMGHRHWPLMIPFQNGPTRGKDVFLPLDYLVGGAAMAGQGWRMLMECLSEGRGISLPAVATGGSKFLYGLTGGYAKIREQFNISISKFEGIRSALAELSGKTFMLQAMRIFTLGPIQEGRKPAIASAIAKYHMTEMARDIVNLSMDIHGGKAIQVGPKNDLFPAYLQIPIGITVEGANILMRNLVIFGQGSVRCHPFLLQELKILSEETESVLDKFDLVLMKHIRFTFSNLAKSILYGLSGGFFVWVKAPSEIKKYAKKMSRMSAAFALMTDMALLVLGGNLKRKETLSGRLADMMGQLYIASSVLKYYADSNYAADQKKYVEWAIDYSLWKMQAAMQDFIGNFPHKIIRILFKLIVFPFGNPYHRPSDDLDNQLAEEMLTDSSIRQAIIEDCYLDNPVEKAFQRSLDLADLLKRWSKTKISDLVPEYVDYETKIQAAIHAGRLTTEEGQKLKEYEKMRIEALMVDEFDKDLKQILTPIS